MNITKLLIEGFKVVLPKLIGLAGYNDASKTGALNMLKDSSKFTVVAILVFVVLFTTFVPAEVRVAILELVTIMDLVE